MARGAHNDDPIRGAIKILTPITGTAISRRAAEVGIELARAAGAELTVLYVSPSKTSPNGIQQRRLAARRHGEAVLKEIVEVADHYDVRVRTKIRISDNPSVAILIEADRALYAKRSDAALESFMGKASARGRELEASAAARLNQFCGLAANGGLTDVNNGLLTRNSNAF